MKTGVIYQDLKTKITATVVIADVYETIYKVECLNLYEESTKIWYQVFSGNTVQTIMFLNMILKSYNSLENNVYVTVDKLLNLRVVANQKLKYLELEINKSLCFYTREELLNIRDSFLKHLKDI